MSEQPSIDDNPTPRGHKMVRFLGATALGLAVLGSAGVAVWQYVVVNNSMAQSSMSATGSRTASSQGGDSTLSNPFVRHANDASVKTCRDMYGALGEALTAGSQYMVQTETTNTDPDKHSVQGLVGLEYEGQGEYDGPAAGVVFATPASGGRNCEGTMVRVVPFQKNCQAAANLLPDGSRQGRTLSGLPVFALPNAGHAMLLPAGSGCVVLSVVRGAG